MNLPQSVYDPSFLQHEPLRTYVTILDTVEGDSRLQAQKVVSRFVDEMQRDDKVRTRDASFKL